MPFFDHYPYTNMHNVNLDWVLQAVKSWGAMVEQNNQNFINLEAANQSFKEFVTNYLNNLDVQEEINAKLDEMLESGELEAYFLPYISTTVGGWLGEHITPTTPALDSSLTVHNAAAESYAVGQKFNDTDLFKGAIDLTVTGSNSSRMWENSVWWVGSGITEQQLSGLPRYGVSGILETRHALVGAANAHAVYQHYKDTSNDNEYSRVCYGLTNNYTVKPWVQLTNPFITVASDGTGQYTSILDAFNACPENGTIFVKPGEYKTDTLRGFRKAVNIIGSGPERTILYNTNGLYANPVLETGVGTFRDITFESRYVSGESEELTTSDNGAYAVHIEGQNDNGYAVGKKCEFINCKFISDFAPGLGVGASKDWTLILDNCELISRQPYTRGLFTDLDGLGGFYMHDQAGSAAKGNCWLRVKNCIIRATVMNNAMCLYDTSGTNNNMVCRFIDNILYSTTSGLNAPVLWRGSDAWAGSIKKDPISYGNNNAQLNA